MLGKSAVANAIKALPGIERWTPIEEALPPEDEMVIVSIHDDSGDTHWRYTSTGWYTEGHVWVVENERNYGVVAWMPFPEPYCENRD